MLQYEALTFALLLSLTHAFPQPYASVPLNTGPTVSPPPATTFLPVAHTEISVSGLLPPPTRPGVEPLTAHIEQSVTALDAPSTTAEATTNLFNIPHVESTVSDIINGAGGSTAMPKAHTENSVGGLGGGGETTPTAITLAAPHTEVPASVTQLGPQQTGGGGEESPAGGGGGNGGTVLSENAGPAPTSDSGILNEIASEINAQGPAATATAMATATGADGGNTNNPSNVLPTASAILISRPGIPPLSTQTSEGAAPQTTGPAALTLGTNALTLTPGLSTVLGTGSATTLVELTTNSAGQTVVVVGTSTSTLATTASSAALSAQASATGTSGGGAVSTGPSAAATSKKSGAIGRERWRCSIHVWAGLSFGFFGGLFLL